MQRDSSKSLSYCKAIQEGASSAISSAYAKIFTKIPAVVQPIPFYVTVFSKSLTYRVNKYGDKIPVVSNRSNLESCSK
jgi:hypothetical protein